MDKVPVASSPPRSKDQVIDKMIHVTELLERKEKSCRTGPRLLRLR
jgi:hypothetical protein